MILRECLKRQNAASKGKYFILQIASAGMRAYEGKEYERAAKAKAKSP